MERVRTQRIGPGKKRTCQNQRRSSGTNREGYKKWKGLEPNEEARNQRRLPKEGNKNQGDGQEPELEFLKSLWGLGTVEE
jgi:hypothetical protein